MGATSWFSIEKFYKSAVRCSMQKEAPIGNQRVMSTCTVYFIVSYALQVSFVLERLIVLRLGGYTDFWNAGVELGDIYKFHTMGLPIPKRLSPSFRFYNRS